MTSARAPIIVAVGPFPPPVHGAARVTDAVTGQFEEICEVRRIDTGGGSRDGTSYHLSRIVAHLHALAVLMAASGRDLRSLYLGGAGGLGLWYQVGVVALARALGYRISYHHHSYAYLTTPSTAMRTLIAVAGPQARHIVLCKDMAADLRRGYPRVQHVIVLSNTIIVPEFTTSPLPIRGRRIRLVHLSNLSFAKGLDRVIDALRQTVRAGHDVELFLAGPPVTVREERLLREAAVEFRDRFRHMGQLPPEQIPQFLANADIFLFPSLYRNEAEPLVVLEAMAAGVPVLSYSIGCAAGIAPRMLPPLNTRLPFGPRVAELVDQLDNHDAFLSLRTETTEQFTRLRDGAKEGLRLLAEWLTWKDDKRDDNP